MADTRLPQLVINQLTKSQYDGLTPNPNELYLVTDEEGVFWSQVATSVSSSSTDSQVPTAKCLYDLLGDVESIINEIRGE